MLVTNRPHSDDVELSVDHFFLPGGLLSESLPGWEERPGQHQMAADVAEAIEHGRNLVVEAGTGTGKTLAYLVPLVLSGKKAVVSTGTKNLQEQLIRKDVPLLEGMLGQTLRVALMKGRRNFLCLQKLREQESKPALKGMTEVAHFALIRDWAKTSRTGDAADLPQLPAGSKLWSRLDARRETCTGRDCALFEDCFVTKMHRRARDADLVVVNHHLFFADLSLRKDDFGSIIPDYQAVVFDEAHEIEGVVGQFFGEKLSQSQFDDLARDTRAAAKRAGFGSRELDRSLQFLGGASKAFFKLFEVRYPREPFAGRSEFRRRHSEQYFALVSAINGFHSHLNLLRGQSEETDPLKSRIRHLRLILRLMLNDVDAALRQEAYDYPVLSLLVEDHKANFVYWLEKRRKSVALRVTPIEVASILDESLFGHSGSVILASATLAVDGNFEFIRGRLGLRSASEVAVPGHFDFRNQAILYVPRDMPLPSHPAYVGRAVREVVRLLGISRGRAFVLCTSYKQMHKLHEEVSKQVPYKCLAQGEGSHASVLDKFRRKRNCVLFATASFWQGVDVPGDQLSCVIVDKLPFAVPTDPVVQARVERIRRHGGNPFVEFQVPEAALALKQGFGRLIRRASDRGILALLDSRIVSKPYGKTFLNSLPGYRLTHSLSDLREFFGDARGTARRFSQGVRKSPGRRRAGLRR